MSSLPSSVQRIYQLLWNPNPTRNPQNSGIYLTRNDRGQEWFRYFDARLGDWYMSWAETQGRGMGGAACIQHADLASEVTAWAHRTRRVHA
jgi:hypothetical protein